MSKIFGRALACLLAVVLMVGGFSAPALADRIGPRASFYFDGAQMLSGTMTCSYRKKIGKVTAADPVDTFLNVESTFLTIGKPESGNFKYASAAIAPKISTYQIPTIQDSSLPLWAATVNHEDKLSLIEGADTRGLTVSVLGHINVAGQGKLKVASVYTDNGVLVRRNFVGVTCPDGLNL